MTYKYKYIMRFNAIKGTFDGLDKYVQTYRIEFTVLQHNTGYSKTEAYLKSIIEQYKNKDIDALKGRHFALEDLAKEIFDAACQTEHIELKKIEVSNSMLNTYILGRD